MPDNRTVISPASNSNQAGGDVAGTSQFMLSPTADNMNHSIDSEVGGGPVAAAHPNNNYSNAYSYIRHTQQQQQQSLNTSTGGNNANDQNNNSNNNNNTNDTLDSSNDNQNEQISGNFSSNNTIVSRRDFFEEIRSGGGHWSQLLRQVVFTPASSTQPLKKLPTTTSTSRNEQPQRSPSGEVDDESQSTLEAKGSSIIGDSQIPFQVLGGSENGQFVYVSMINPEINDWIAVGYLQTGDVILEIQGQQVAGYTQADVLSLLHHCLRWKTVLIVAPRGSLGPELRSYLNTRFQKGSVDHALQGVVRDNLYLRTVPVTTRAPRAGEIHGVDYTFLSPEEFMELERNGSLLESGVYAGNHYGTPKPWATRLRSANLQTDGSDGDSMEDHKKSSMLPGMHPSSEGKRRRNRSNVEALGAGDDEPPSPSATRSSDPSGQFSSRPPPQDELGPLPANWEMSYTEKGEVYFIDHNTGTSHWLDPRLSRIQKLSLEECADNELPFGWEKIEDPHYGTYYIDHVNRRTQFENPVLQAKQVKPNESSNFEGQVGSPVHKSPTKIPPVAPPKPPGNRVAAQRVKTPVEFMTDSVQSSNLNNPEFGGRPMMPSTSSGSGFNMKTGGRDPERNRFFTRDPSQLIGERLETVLFKSSRGLGFTIVGGDDDDGLDEFLQIKSVVADGPAWRDGKLRTGDVLVTVNGTCVLGYTHQEMVSIFQSISPGEEVHLEACRGYPLPFDPADPNTEIVTTVAVAPVSSDSAEKRRQGDWTGRTASPDSLPHSAHSLPELSNERAAYGKSNNNNGRPASVDLLLDGPPGHTRYEKESTKRYSIDPGIFLTIDIIKGGGGFGFTIADSVAGQKVKKVLDPSRCGGLEESDRLIAIDGIDLRGLSHTQVVQVLKDFPLGKEASLIIQRTNGQPTYPFKSNSGISKNYTDPKHFPQRTSFIPRSKTPTADLGRTRPRLRDTLPERPKTPLLDSIGQLNGYNNYNGDMPNSIQQMYPYMPDKQQMSSKDLEASNSSAFAINDLNQMPTIREWVDLTIDLQRRQEGFGFRIVGGTEEGSQVSVGHIVPRGAAALDGRLQTNDQLTSIDGVSVIGASHHSVVQLMARSAAAGRVRLCVKRPVFGSVIQQTEPDSMAPTLHSPVEAQLVILRRHPPEGFGFVIISSASKSGATIGRIVDGSPADRCGQLQVGDRILAVNQIDISQLHHSQVVQLIKDSGLTLSLSVIPAAQSNNLMMSYSQLSPGHRVHDIESQNVKGRQSYDFGTAFISPDEHSFSGSNMGSQTQYVENMEQLFAVQLARGARGFGFSIRGGKEFQNMPLFVLRLAEDGPASVDGRMQVGDQILQINGYNTSGMTHAQAINIIKNGGANIHLLLRRGPIPFPFFGQMTNFQTGGYFGANGHEEEQSISSNNDSQFIGQNSPMYRDAAHN